MTKEQYKDAINALEKYSDFLRAKIENLKCEKRRLEQIANLKTVRPLRWNIESSDGKISYSADFDHLHIRIYAPKDHYPKLLINERIYECRDLEQAQDMANTFIKNIVKEALYGKEGF